MAAAASMRAISPSSFDDPQPVDQPVGGHQLERASSVGVAALLGPRDGVGLEGERRRGRR